MLPLGIVTADNRAAMNNHSDYVLVELYGCPSVETQDKGEWKSQEKVDVEIFYRCRGTFCSEFTCCR